MKRLLFADWTPVFLWVAFGMTIGIALVLAGCAGCAHIPPAPAGALEAGGLQRLYCVDHDAAGACTIYRSAQPTAAQFTVLVARYGLRSVVKLNSALAIDGGHDQVPGGVELFHHPMSSLLEPTPALTQAILDEIDAAPKPVLIHCAHGEDRTGLIVGLWRVRHGTPAQSAWGEMLHFGFHTDLVGLVHGFEDETGYRP